MPILRRKPGYIIRLKVCDFITFVCVFKLLQLVVDLIFTYLLSERRFHNINIYYLASGNKVWHMTDSLREKQFSRGSCSGFITEPKLGFRKEQKLS